MVWPAIIAAGASLASAALTKDKGAGEGDGGGGGGLGGLSSLPGLDGLPGFSDSGHAISSAGGSSFGGLNTGITRASASPPIWQTVLIAACVGLAARMIYDAWR